jgi:uncharacterized caspase-like protein
MKLFTNITVFTMLILVVCTNSFNTTASSNGYIRDPFEISFPDAGKSTYNSLTVKLPNIEITRVQFIVKKPFSDKIESGDINTWINGEAAGTICGVNIGSAGYIVKCDLSIKPRFKLKLGKNVAEIKTFDESGNQYYASFVILIGGRLLDSDIEKFGLTSESITVNDGNDQEAPIILLTSPKGSLPVLNEKSTLVISGIVRDDKSDLDYVNINGNAAKKQTLTKKPPINSERGVGTKNTVLPASDKKFYEFEQAILIGSNKHIDIEAKDQAGNIARLTIPIAQNANPIEFTGEKFAVIIGISQYQYNEGGLNNLQYADADAESMRSFLKTQEGGSFPDRNILFLTNNKATLDGLKAALKTHLKRAKRNDLIFIFIAGHGSPDPYSPQNLYFLLSDSKVADMPKTAFSMTELQRYLDNDVVAERVIVFIDTCHSAGISGTTLVNNRGVGIKENNIINNRAISLFKEKGRAVITSSDVEEVSQESQKWGNGHGVFTWALIEGLTGKADFNNDKQVTTGELFNFVRGQVQTETNFAQNPKAAIGNNKDLTLAITK